MRKKGVRVLSGGYIGCQTYIGEKISNIPVTDIGFFQSEENSRFLAQQGILYDFRHQLIFTCGKICCNLSEKPVLQKALDSIFADEHLEATYGMTHEQYFFPRYFNYLPDHAERMELVLRQFHEHGYRFVFFNEGFLGNTTPLPEY